MHFIQACNRELFKAGEISWNKDTSINRPSTTHKKLCFNEKYIPQIDAIWALFLQNKGTFFRSSKKGREGQNPLFPLPTGCTSVQSR